VISCVWEATTAKRMQIDPYCQRQICSPVNVLSSDIRVMQIFAGIWEIWGVKQKSDRLRCRFSYLSLAIFSESSSPRLKSATHSICVKLLHKHDKLTHCCRAFTLALARLSCLLSFYNWPLYEYLWSTQTTTTTTILRSLIYRSNCISQYLQLTTAGFC